MSDQAARFSDLAVRYNAQMTGPQIRKLCRLTRSAKATLGQSITELGFSARTHDKILRVSQTIADMVDVPIVVYYSQPFSRSFRILAQFLRAARHTRQSIY